MAERPSQPFVTSVRVENGAAHDYVTVWIRGANVGTLVVGRGDGEALRALLTGELTLALRLANPMRTVIGIDLGADSEPLTPWMTGALEAMRPHEPDDEVFAAPPRHAMTEKMTLRDATDVEQLNALAGTIREMRERGDRAIDAALVREARETVAGLPPGKTPERVPFFMKGPLAGAPRLRQPGPWSTHEQGSVHRDRAYLTPTFSPDVAPATIKRCTGCRAVAGDGPCPICGSCSFEEGEP